MKKGFAGCTDLSKGAGNIAEGRSKLLRWGVALKSGFKKEVSVYKFNALQTFS
jgi:hypothetical protein